MAPINLNWKSSKSNLNNLRRTARWSLAVIAAAWVFLQTISLVVPVDNTLLIQDTVELDVQVGVQRVRTEAQDLPDDNAASVPIDSESSSWRADSTFIRSWGCARNETPLIFLHIGKAGGGGVRARFAASARDYNRTLWYRPKEDPSYFYPMYDANGTLRPGKMVTSDAPNMLPHPPNRPEDLIFHPTFKFEGSLPCHATTPLGHATACHMEKDICDVHRAAATASGKDSDRCDIVYMGHNALGTELNFLPTGYLSNWWNSTVWGRGEEGDAANNNTVASRLAHRMIRSHRVFGPTPKMERKCHDGPIARHFYNLMYQDCIHPEILLSDAAARTAVAGGDSREEDEINWGPVYASLPVLRVTILREPFAWLKSKFFWMEHHMGIDGEGIVLADPGEWTMKLLQRRWKPADQERYQNTPLVRCDDLDHFTRGWGKQAALGYIFSLCGENCMGQWQSIQDTYVAAGDETILRAKHAQYLKVMEDQAAYNLRNSFAVVGILDKTPEFYDMIAQRVFYMNPYRNLEVVGLPHNSGIGPEVTRCHHMFHNATFQREVLEKGPEIAAMLRLYEIGVEVNKFQVEEMAECPT